MQMSEMIKQFGCTTSKQHILLGRLRAVAQRCRAGRDVQVACSFLVAVLLCLGFAGCQAITNPVANGIPVRLVPEELLGEPKGDLETIPLDWLRQPPPAIYRLSAGDIMGIYIDGVLGQKDQLPPVSQPEGDLPPAIGLPVPVREDGTIPLPLVDPINVEGMSILEAEQAVVEAYTVKKEILQKDRARIIVSLIRPRQTRVLVVRQDSGGGGSSISVSRGPLTRSGPAVSISGAEQRGTGTVVDLPAYENDVLNALTRTGGLPGLDAVNEVIILRGAENNLNDSEIFRGYGADDAAVTRIPLRIRKGERRPFQPEDVILNKGDIVFIERRGAELFYTGGILGNREVPLPRDYDLRVVEAVIQAGGPLVNGLTRGNNLTGAVGGGGIGTPNPSQLSVLRRLPDGRQVNIKVNLNRAIRDPRENILVQKGDVLVLQETPGEAAARYVTNIFSATFFGRWLNRADAEGTANVAVP